MKKTWYAPFAKLLQKMPDGLDPLPGDADPITARQRFAYHAALEEAARQGDIRALLFFRTAYARFGNAILEDSVWYGVARVAMMASSSRTALRIMADIRPVETWVEKDAGHVFAYPGWEGDENALKIFLDAGLDVNTRVHPYDFTETMLSIACQKHTNLIPFLHSRGADLDLRYGVKRNTLLCSLLSRNRTDRYLAAQSLLALGADPDIADKDGNTAPMCITDETPEAIGRAVLEKCKHPEARNHEGKTAFLHLCTVGKVDYLTAGPLANADWHAVDAKGRNAAHYAVTADQGVHLHRLESRGVALDLPDKEGRTPIHHAAGNRRWSLVGMLAAKGADLHRPDPATGLRPFETLLQRLKKHGNKDAHVLYAPLYSFLERGADLLLPDKDGLTPLDYAEAFKKESSGEYNSSAERTSLTLRSWQEDCRVEWLNTRKPWQFHHFVEDGVLTEMARQLAGAGLLDEAFTPERWQGRLDKAHEVLQAVRPLLPEFQRQRYDARIDIAVFQPRTLSESSFADRAKFPLPPLASNRR